MSHGMRVYAANGTTVLFDSELASGGVYLGNLTFAIGNSSSYTWTEAWLTNKTLRAQVVVPGQHDYVFDLNGAQPRVTWTSYARTNPRATTITVWAA